MRTYTPKAWLVAEVLRRQREGRIPIGNAASLLSRQLAEQMRKDVRCGRCVRAISAPSIRVRLYEWRLWPPPRRSAQ
jgi:hypothetical protein